MVLHRRFNYSAWTLAVGCFTILAATRQCEAQILVGVEGCPDFTVMCPMVYAPVVCDNGVTYFNQCAATYWGCATGCEPTGGGILFSTAETIDADEDSDTDENSSASSIQQGGIDARSSDVKSNSDSVLLDQLEVDESLGGLVPIGGGCPDFTILCPMIYDPVVCDDGQTYFNQCAATYWGCATGCESTGGGILFQSTNTGDAGSGLDNHTLVPQPIDRRGEAQLLAAAISNDALDVMIAGHVDSGKQMVARDDESIEPSDLQADRGDADAVFIDQPVDSVEGLLPIGGGCPDFTVLCPMIFDPVVCDDGEMYFNLCAATYWSCATSCESTGGGVIE